MVGHPLPIAIKQYENLMIVSGYKIVVWHITMLLVYLIENSFGIQVVMCSNVQKYSKKPIT